jgi:hypothetical protein
MDGPISAAITLIAAMTGKHAQTAITMRSEHVLLSADPDRRGSALRVDAHLLRAVDSKPTAPLVPPVACMASPSAYSSGCYLCVSLTRLDHMSLADPSRAIVARLLPVLYRLRTATSAVARRAKNSCSERAPAAATDTSRCKVTRGHPAARRRRRPHPGPAPRRPRTPRHTPRRHHFQRHPVLPRHPPPAAGTRPARPRHHPGPDRSARPVDRRNSALANCKLGRITAEDADGYHRVMCPAVVIAYLAGHPGEGRRAIARKLGRQCVIRRPGLPGAASGDACRMPSRSAGPGARYG